MIFNLKKITVRQLFELSTEEFIKYMELQNAMKSRKVFNNREGIAIGSLSFGEVSEIKRIFISPTPEGIFETFKSIFKKTTKHEFLRSDVISYFYALNWIGEEIKNLIEREQQALASDPDPLMEEAGSKRLQTFGELPTLLNLAERFATTPQVIETWKYNMVFAIMLHDKTTADVQKKYHELKKTYGRN